jgi:hypothetical protein
MSITISTVFNKGDDVWVVESFYREQPKIRKVKVDHIMGQSEMPSGHDHKGMCDLTSDKLEISYLLSNGWFADETQLFITLGEAVEAFNNEEHKKFIS